MKRVQTERVVACMFAMFCSLIVVGSPDASAQSRGETNALRPSENPARPVIIPLTIRVKGEVVPSELEMQTFSGGHGQRAAALSYRGVFYPGRGPWIGRTGLPTF